MRRYRIAARGAGRCAVLALLLGVAMVGAASPSARAGNWMVVACENPDGSAAPSEGWSGYPVGSPPVGSDNRATCSPGTPMQAYISNASPAPSQAMEVLQYTPPAGSKLIGGRLQVAAGADGSGPYGRGAVGFYEPQLASDESNAFFACVYGLGWCNGADDFTGTLNLPSDRGGNLYAEADCRTAGGNCDTGGSNGAYAWLQIASADLLLQDSAVPLATAFGGSALDRPVRGTGQLTFTADEQQGPGIYAVSAAIDGRAVYGQTPDTNGGACVPVGTDPASGALMFDSVQPCPMTEGVDVPVPTAGLPDGAHRLAVTLTDAAGNAATVLDTTIHTSNPQRTPVARRGVRAQFVISWRWLDRHTTLRSVSVARLPRHGHISVRCSGHGCPRLKVNSVSVRHVGRLLRALRGRRFTAGDTLLIAVTAPDRRRERVTLRIRDNRMPRARLVR